MSEPKITRKVIREIIKIEFPENDGPTELIVLEVGKESVYVKDGYDNYGIRLNIKNWEKVCEIISEIGADEVIEKKDTGPCDVPGCRGTFRHKASLNDSLQCNKCGKIVEEYGNEPLRKG